jgi:hypothetical protein
MDLDDKVLHYLLIGGGLFVGSLVKTAVDYVAKALWGKEVSLVKKLFKKETTNAERPVDCK